MIALPVTPVCAGTGDPRCTGMHCGVGVVQRGDRLIGTIASVAHLDVKPDRGARIPSAQCAGRRKPGARCKPRLQAAPRDRVGTAGLSAPPTFAAANATIGELYAYSQHGPLDRAVNESPRVIDSARFSTVGNCNGTTYFDRYRYRNLRSAAWQTGRWWLTDNATVPADNGCAATRKRIVSPGRNAIRRASSEPPCRTIRHARHWMGA